MSRSPSPPPWEIESSQHLQDYQMFSVRRVRARSPRNDTVHDFDIVEGSDGVTVLAFTPEGEMVLVEQYRVPVRGVNLETPSGVLEEGEDPVRAGERELREETGYAAEDFRHLGTLVLNPSWETTRVHVVSARNARRVAERDLDAGEDTRVRLCAAGEARRLLREGRINAAVVVAAFQLLDVHGEGDAIGAEGA